MYIFFKNLIYILYRYYDQGGTKSVAYYCAISGLLIVFYLNLMTLFSLFNIDLSLYLDYSKPIKYLIFFFLFLLFFLLLKAIYKEDEIKQYEPNFNYKTSITLFFIYLIASFIMFIIVIKK